MLQRLYTVLLFVVLPLLWTELSGQGKSYLCPEFGLQFTSQTELIPKVSNDECGTVAFTNRNGNLLITFWRIKGLKDDTGLLEKILRAEGLTAQPVNSAGLDPDGKGRIICATGQSMQCPYRYIYASFRLEDSVLLMRIRCPEECFPDHLAQVRFLIRNLNVST